MKHLLKYTWAVIAFVLLSTSVSWGGALDGKAIVCNCEKQHSWGMIELNNKNEIVRREETTACYPIHQHIGVKFKKKYAHKYVFWTEQDKIEIRHDHPKGKGTFFSLDSDKVEWTELEKFQVTLHRKTLKLTIKTDYTDKLGNLKSYQCKVYNSSDYDSEMNRLLHYMQRKYDSSTSGNKI